MWGSRPMYRQPELDLALVTTMNRTAYTFQDLPQLVALPFCGDPLFVCGRSALQHMTLFPMLTPNAT